MKTGWKVTGNDAGRRIAEFKASNENENLLSYEEAKQTALKQLRDQVAPYQIRIAELEGDVFQTAGALPPMKAWQTGYFRKNYLVAATSKKRAREIVGESRHWFDENWSACEGDWWYRLARHESVWMVERDEQGSEIGTFNRCLTQDEAAALLEQHADFYRTIDASHLLRLVGEGLIEANVSTAGTHYKITTTVQQCNWDHANLHVECRIDDGCNLVRHPAIYFGRELPQDAVIAGWKTEGF